MNRSLKDEMRAAMQGDRERAEARRQAEEGEYNGPAPPTLELKKPTRGSGSLPAKPVAEEAEVLQPELAPEESPEPEPRSSLGFLERLQGLFRRT